MPKHLSVDDDQDALGRSLLACYEGETPAEIIEREDGYIDASAGSAKYFSSYGEWSEDQQEAMTYARGRVLGIGCGAGRHAFYLQGQGLDVVGADISSGAVEVCRRRGLQQVIQLSVTQVSRARLGPFDSIDVLGNNFGLMANAKRARWLSRRFYGLTSEHGLLVLASNDVYRTEDPFHLVYQAANRERGRMSGQICGFATRHTKTPG